MPKVVKRNPEETAAERFEFFHGRKPDRIYRFESQVREHTYLSGIGRLKVLTVINLDGENVTLENFRGAILSQNEHGTQLFISGGDQSVDLAGFGIEREAHEKELLGTVSGVYYHTTKDHLAPEDGGEAIYHHEFGGRGKRRPVLCYDTVNRLLSFAGGDYSIPAEGILE